MENLEELHCHSTKVNLENPETLIAFDYADGLVCAIDSSHLIILLQEGKPEESGSVHKIDTIGKLRHVKYLSIFNIVFLATENELVLYDHENEKIISLLTVESPITELSWNPLETLLIVVHENFDITSYIATRHFIQLKDKSNLNAGVPVPVLSGWGSTDTQFQGPKKRKKVVASTEEIQVVPSGPPKMSWRGNGELFVVNYFSNNQRFLKVFDADLIALNQSEQYASLQEPVAFMGQGQCIACCAVKNGKTQLVIFEKNCKVKAEFDMVEIQGSVKKLLYHPQMNLLAISYIDNEGNNLINIYLYSNGRWFFKQQLNYPPEHKIHNFQWLNLSENLFTTCKMVVFTSQNVENHYFRFIINRCPGTSIVAVINGKRIDFSLFDKKILPPPFSYYSFEHDAPVNRILFHPTRNICVLVDSLFHVRILNLKDDAVEDILGLSEHKFTGKVEFLSVAWENDSVALTLQNESKQEIIKRSEMISVSLRTEDVGPNIYLPYSDTPLMLPYKRLGNANNYIYLTKRVVQEHDKQLDFEFALSGNREFYVNDSVVCYGVTSFYIFKDYLIFTHSNSKLYCIRLCDHLVYSNDLNLKKVFNREIEQGGVIVTCTNLTSPQIILQMPRGNVETISCKMITIDVIEGMLKENKWSEVLHILRIEKVNWNVLIDLNPERFRAHIKDFVAAAKNNAILSNIVTEFCLDENCFQTFYKNYLPFGVPKFAYDKKAIVEDLLLHLVSTDCVNNLPSIAAVQQKHISLKAALKSIKDVFNSDRVKHEAICGKILKQVLLQEHYKDVENAAYNLYDLDFLSLVYRNGSDDPKIYEPEIKVLRSAGVMERKFKMSVRGRNFAAAVKYLLRWEVAEEEFISNFITKNHLEDTAYFSMEDYHKHFVLVTILYAKTLSIVKKHVEAGVILKKAKLYKEALLEFQKGLEWREVTSICSKLNYEREQEVRLLEELADDLVKENRIGDAVLLLETYTKNYRAAINVLVQQNVFRRAVCLAETYREHDLVETQIVPKLIEYMSVLLEKFDNLTKQFESYADRLDAVREERISKLHMASLGVYDEQDDLYSEASSHSRATSRSRGSTLSSRNRRKEERKKIDLKEGGYYEDIALIRTLHMMYGEVFKFGEEIKEICLIGYEYNVKLSRQLHGSLCQLQNSMIDRIPKIWSEVFLKEEESYDHAIVSVIQNKQDLDPEYRTPPSVAHAKSWRLEIFS